MKELFIKYSQKIKIWKSSSIQFKEFYSIFKRPKKLILVEHNFKLEEIKKINSKNVFIQGKEIINLLDDDIESYPNLLCINCKDNFVVSDINSDDLLIMNRFILENEEYLGQELSSVGNDFVLYTHDDGYYSCFWSKVDEFKMLESILNVKILNNTGSVLTDSDNFKLIQKNISNGIYFDISSVSINYACNEVTFLLYICDPNKDFSPAICEAKEANSYYTCTLKFYPTCN